MSVEKNYYQEDIFETCVTEIKLPDRPANNKSKTINRDKDVQKNFLWQTRSLAIKQDDRGKFASKEIAHVTITSETGISREGVYCLDALGSETGMIITGDDSLSKEFKGVKNLKITIKKAEPKDIATWLNENFDPERKALGAIFKQSLSQSDYLEKKLGDLADKAGHEFTAAKSAREDADRAKKGSLFIGGLLFLLGTVVDVGLWEEKIGMTVSAELLLMCTFIILILLGSWYIWKKRYYKFRH
jgi:hypothetical protein